MTSNSSRTIRRLLPLLGLSVAGALAVAACGSDPVAQFKKENQIDEDMGALVAKGIPGVGGGLHHGGPKTPTG